jgi:D-alanine-D-alanine ligase-like ATP-grasp enzyme
LTNINPAFLHGWLFCAKSEILKQFQKNAKTYKEFFAKTIRIKKDTTLPERIVIVQKFIHDNHLHYPLIIKPDRGLAGIGVSLVRDEEDMIKHIHYGHEDYLLQEYIDRPKEISVFYIKDPEEKKGKIRSITERTVTTKNGKIPAMIIPGNKVVNKDESYLIDPIVESVFNEISDMEGFYFWRYDIRVRDIQEFIKTGKDFKILEVNVWAQTMAVQAYDHKYNIFQKYAIFAQQLQFAFHIARENLDSYPQQKKSIQNPIRDFVSVYRQILKRFGE